MIILFLYHRVGITKPDVYRELNNKLDDKDRILFEKLVKHGIKEGYVIHSRHKFRLKMPFKNLPQDLRIFHVNLSRTDRNLIALMYQIKGDIKTNDDGIEKTLRLLRNKDTPWRKYALSIDSPPTEDFVEHPKK